MISTLVMTAALAASEPYWTPGEDHGYHVNTFGFLVGEPVRRATGLEFARAFRERVAGPHAADFHIGLPDPEHGRVARIVEGGQTMSLPTALLDGLLEPVRATVEVDARIAVIHRMRTPRQHRKGAVATHGSHRIGEPLVVTELRERRR